MLYAALIVCVVAESILKPGWVGLAIVAVVAWGGLSTLAANRKVRRMRGMRVGHDIGTFARMLPIRALDTWVVRATYDEIAAHIGSDANPFPVHPSDRLKADLGIDDENLCDIIFRIADRSARTTDDIDKNPYIAQIKTVGDVIQAVMWQQQIAGDQPGRSADIETHNPRGTDDSELRRVL